MYILEHFHVAAPLKPHQFDNFFSAAISQFRDKLSKLSDAFQTEWIIFVFPMALEQLHLACTHPEPDHTELAIQFKDLV